MRSDVGQIFNLRPIFNRPAAGMRKLLGRRDQARRNRIELNVSDNAPKLGPVADNPIVRFVLPERLTREVENPIRLQSSESLQRLGQFRNRHVGSN